jgi:hypothetical protein
MWYYVYEYIDDGSALTCIIIYMYKNTELKSMDQSEMT